MKTFLYTEETKSGKGVFTLKDIVKGENILQFKGKFMTYQDFPTHYTKFEDHCVQINDNLYLGPSGDIDDLFNHSCNPNSGLRIEQGKVTLIALKKISAGEEITWDYSTTMDEDFWEMDCECDSEKCRKKIRDFKHLPAETQNYYIDLGIVPEYIIRKL